MEGKSVRAVIIMGLLILGLVVTQIEAVMICCKNAEARKCWIDCRNGDAKFPLCENKCKCYSQLVSSTCPPGYPYSSMHENFGVFNEYCKLGCASSVCDTLTTNQNSGNEAVERCVNACSELCNKGAKTALASA